MSLNYDTIINFFENNEKDTFKTKYNILKYDTDFSCFKDIFNNKYYRYGLPNTYMSLITSVLFVSDKKFIIMDLDEQISTVKKINSELNILHKDIPKYSKFNYNDILIELISDHLKLNFLIFDFEDNNIYAVNCDANFNPLRPIVFLATKDKYFEPIIKENHRLFSYNDNIVKKILSKNISYFDIPNLNKKFKLSSDYKKFVTKTDNSPSIYIKKNTNNFTETKLKKLKKDNLFQLVEDLNIKININNPKKDDLIKLILEY